MASRRFTGPSPLIPRPIRPTALLAALAAGPLQAQPPAPCGTTISPTEAAALLAIQHSGIYDRPPVTDATASIGLTLHVVRRSDGTGGISAAQLAQAVADANTAFRGSGIQFCQAGSPLFIDSSAYYDITSAAEADALRALAVVPGTINCYFVNSLDTGAGALCGLSSFTISPVQGIICANACVGVSGDAASFPHEVGHYFNLYHTHETAFGVECTDGSNCVTAGDLVCDTPADPNVLDHVNSACQWTGSATPPCGSLPYNPPVHNFMSYAPASCRNEFTPFQNWRAVTTLFSLRPELDRNHCGPLPCYANCDHSSVPPVLNVNDFSCFLNKFSSGDPYANCDGSTTPPVLNVLDFSCFLNAFAQGCDALPDITLSNLSTPAAIAPGEIFDVTFDVHNSGAAPLFGTFFVGAGLSLGDCTPENGNDLPLPPGQPITVDPPLLPGQSRQFVLQGLHTPQNPVISNAQYIILGADTDGPLPCRAICEQDETNNTVCGSLPVQLTDLKVDSITALVSSPISGSSIPVDVTVRNLGPGYAYNTTVTAQIAGGAVSLAVTPDPVIGPFETRVIHILNVPVGVFSSHTCGAPESVPITAWANFPLDPNTIDNQLTQQMQAVGQYWNLEVTIPVHPAIGYISGVTGTGCVTTCSPTSWTVHVHNSGNVQSPGPVRVLSGITLNNVCFNWSQTLGQQQFFDCGAIDAGDTITHTFHYPIPCGPWAGTTQYIKAEICNSGCPTIQDLCLEGNCATPPPAISIQLCPP